MKLVIGLLALSLKISLLPASANTLCELGENHVRSQYDVQWGRQSDVSLIRCSRVHIRFTIKYFAFHLHRL